MAEHLARPVENHDAPGLRESQGQQLGQPGGAGRRPHRGLVEDRIDLELDALGLPRRNGLLHRGHRGHRPARVVVAGVHCRVVLGRRALVGLRVPARHRGGRAGRGQARVCCSACIRVARRRRRRRRDWQPDLERLARVDAGRYLRSIPSTVRVLHAEQGDTRAAAHREVVLGAAVRDAHHLAGADARRAGDTHGGHLRLGRSGSRRGGEGL